MSQPGGAAPAQPSGAGFNALLELSAKVVEAVGVAVIVASVPVALALAVRHGRMARAWDLYPSFRRGLGRGILLGLEFLVAADIIRTVTHYPSLADAGSLALIVLIRTFVSFTLEVELEGRWPWQRGGE